MSNKKQEVTFSAVGIAVEIEYDGKEDCFFVALKKGGVVVNKERKKIKRERLLDLVIPDEKPASNSRNKKTTALEV